MKVLFVGGPYDGRLKEWERPLPPHIRLALPVPGSVMQWPTLNYDRPTPIRAATYRQYRDTTTYEWIDPEGVSR